MIHVRAVLTIEEIISLVCRAGAFSHVKVVPLSNSLHEWSSHARLIVRNENQAGYLGYRKFVARDVLKTIAIRHKVKCCFCGKKFKPSFNKDYPIRDDSFVFPNAIVADRFPRERENPEPIFEHYCSKCCEATYYLPNGTDNESRAIVTLAGALSQCSLNKRVRANKGFAKNFGTSFETQHFGSF